MRKKLENFWYYHKIHVLIGIAALAVMCYLGLPSLGSAEPDYEIGLVCSVPLPEETVENLTRALEAQCHDLGGDGKVTVWLHTYYANLAGEANYEVIAALDADLVGRKSGIFLLEDVPAFQQATGGLLSEEFGTWKGFSLCIRKDAAEEYRTLWEQLQK